MTNLTRSHFSCPNLSQLDEKYIKKEGPIKSGGTKDLKQALYPTHFRLGSTSITYNPKLASIFRHYYPEGGWGYVILVIGVLSQILNQGLQWSLSISGTFYFLRHFKAGTLELSDLGWLGAFSTSFSFIISPITMSFCIRKSTRLTAVFGGLITALGVLFTSFAVQFHQLFISYGIIIGLGVGMTRDPCTLMIGQYFKRKRELMEIFLVSSSGIGLAVMSIFLQFALRSLGWILGLQLVTGVICITFIFGTFHRSASLYHPQRRAILHLKSQKRKIKSKDKTIQEETPPFLDFKTLKSRTVQILLLSIAVSSFGLNCPLYYITQQALIAEVRGNKLLLLNVYLGLGWSFGCCLFGCIIIYGDGRIPRQYLCQASLFMSGVSVLTFTGIEAYRGFVIFAWIYGFFLGGYNYTLKMYIYEKVRARNFGRAWGFTQCAVAISNVLGVFISGQLNIRFGNKVGFLFSSVAIVLGSLVMILVDVHRRNLRKKHSHNSSHHHHHQGSRSRSNICTSVLPHINNGNSSGSHQHHPNNTNSTVCKVIESENKKISSQGDEKVEEIIDDVLLDEELDDPDLIEPMFRRRSLKPTVSLFSREEEDEDDLDFDIFYENYCCTLEEGGRRKRVLLLDDDVEYLNDNITSCSKVENRLVFSEYEQNLIKETEGLKYNNLNNNGDGARKLGRKRSSILFKQPSDLGNGRRLSKSHWWNESKRNITPIDEASV
ncbi:monocarboxylate transporter 2 isoform X2 [Lepeophtheirus salmonis]|uniref:monocarboxylate transporter 2 isoform X2 n=1 Tax=Lepeophtheirus salmonis TaxID=72036 RepID=UPI003AF34AB0